MTLPLRIYSYCFGGAFWISLAVALAVQPEAMPPLEKLALLLAIAIAGEELVVRQRARQGGTVLSFSALAHIAAAITLGPLAAAMIAALGVVIVDGLRHDERRFVLINSAMFGSSIWIAGELYQAAGGGDGALDHRTLLAATVLVAARYLITTLIFSFGAAIAAHGRWVDLLRQVAVEDLGAAAGEGSLGVLVAYGIAGDWIVLPLLVPLLGALYKSKATFLRLKDETATALASVAHVIDARDPSTAEHTERVAGYVERFAEAIRLPDRERQRLVQAAKFHDLGKIAVDVSTLLSRGRLSPAERDTILRHPRLSGHLLSPFHFAQEMALFVELHHERYDGNGYYSVPPAEIPVEAHVLIVADSLDAMTSNRSYRAALSRAEAARELLANAGTQFHPVVARVFAAIALEQRPEDLLAPAEIEALRRSFMPVRLVSRPALRPFVDSRAVAVQSAALAMVLWGVPAVPDWAAAPAGLAAIAAAARSLANLVSSRRRQQRALRAQAAGESPAGVLAAAGLDGWVAWLESDPPMTRFSPAAVAAAADVPEGELEAACRWATRRERRVETRLPSGTWLSLEEARRGELRLAIGLRCAPSPIDRNLIRRLLLHLDPPEREEAHAVDRRVAEPSRRAVFLVELGMFDDIRAAAGQLVAERVMDEAERRMRSLVRGTDAVTRIDDDKFGIACLVADAQGVEAVRGRLYDILVSVRVPARSPKLKPRIVAAFGPAVERTPALAALNKKLTPHASAWVAAAE